MVSADEEQVLHSAGQHVHPERNTDGDDRNLGYQEEGDLTTRRTEEVYDPGHAAGTGGCGF